MSAHVRIVERELLCDDWSELHRTTLDVRRRDGNWSRITRETYDRGNGATILLYEPDARTVLLVRQFRYPAYVNGHPDGMLLETPAGLLDGDDPESAIRREAEEETGVRVGEVTRICELFMSPGSVTERIAFFAAPYSAADRVSAGGGVAAEGEDIELVELPLAEAIAMAQRGEIADGKTILLLQWAQLTQPWAQLTQSEAQLTQGEAQPPQGEAQPPQGEAQRPQSEAHTAQAGARAC